MDRQIVYPAQIPLDSDQLNAQRNAYVGLGQLAAMAYGWGTVSASGFACTPGSGLALVIAPGSLLAPGVVDASAYGTLSAVGSALVRQYVSRDPVTLTVPGTGATYTVYVTPATVDTDDTVLPFYNAADPSVTYAGADNSGKTAPTVRQDLAQLGIGATVPSGAYPLWTITVPAGATSITAAMIVQASGAPFYDTIPQLQEAKQDALGFTPVQQGGGVYQATTKVFVGKDSTYSGLRYSYLDPNNNNALTEGGYLVSSYGTILSGSTQVGDLTINSDGRLAFQSVKMADVYTVAANYSDVIDVSNVLANEITAREADTATRVSGTLSMASGDSQGQGLHWSGSLGAPMFAYGPGAGSTTVVQIALNSQLSGYVNGGATSGGNYKGKELYLASNGHPTFAYDGGSQQLALPGDIATPMPFASSGTYTVVQGVSRIFFEAVGAGGPGALSYGSDSSTSIFAAGGGAGAYARGWLAVTEGDVVAVSIGAGGVCPDNTTNATVYGGSTTIAINGTTVLTCTGGESGVWTDVNHCSGGSPGNVTSSGACTVQLQADGGFGHDGQSSALLSKGNGAPGPWGGGGRAGDGGGTGGNAPGAGGGGAYNDTGNTEKYYGGSGGPGYAILTTAP
ncbi:glycine-rich domain-containing protein [Gluconacetobacter entanii]|uniref:glycine-rich domain-containing protein n=1 Tax=Gluconacetobacter entanii TaxID=108528 RepID=UPI0021BBFA41|nr:hypothetical protein [Gluconacetobacter entanii]MCW4579211.1 hypothetical protein [Gluconacetobacter entanii]MCW4582600.1 hypothetical protein [Gluconacetobacter entanii]MCW4585991.1 hypothetical protein [Gluconacetobacter entanii]